ncbi:hypothetical protein SB717_38930, partial [Priestia sp. SIMBA_032]|uniref:hypothetical protein n=1 Tax=Priestia sp. SIMBA_032 TaxID=3085775 RepID=UPI0039791327
ADAYVAMRYGTSTYWVERADFDSKYAFTVVQNLMALAEAETNSKAPVVTIRTPCHQIVYVLLPARKVRHDRFPIT